MKRYFLTIKRTAAVILTAVSIAFLPYTAYAQPAYNIEGVDVLQEAVTENSTIVVENGSAESYVPSEIEYGDAAQVTPSVIETENGNYYVLEKGRTSFESVTQNYILYCGLDMVRSSYPPDVPLSKGTEVTLEIPTGVTAQLYWDGVLMEEYQKYTISEPGRYVLQLTNVSGKTETFDFVILDDRVNYLRDVSVPDGFRLNYVEHEGARLTLRYNNYCELLVDGNYRIGWVCEPTNTYYHTDFILDTQPPQLSLPQVIDGEASEPVTLEDLEKDAYVYYEIDGFAYTTDSAQTVLDEQGRYKLVVYDAAGNSTEYAFTINIYVDVYGYVALIMIVALIGGLIFYSRWLKKHMRVG